MLPFDPTAHTPLHIALAVVLAWAAIVDIKTRTIPNRAWIVAAAVLLPLRVLAAVHDPVPVLTTIAWGLGLTVTSWLLWITRTWAGADAKGTMLLSWAVPIYWTGTAWIHPLLVSIPLALGMVLAWQKVKPGAVPFYAFYAPTTVLASVFFWWHG